ncbi:MAG: hypothetical protein AAF549_05625 [Pseudomonadota bacterium]
MSDVSAANAKQEFYDNSIEVGPNFISKLDEKGGNLFEKYAPVTVVPATIAGGLLAAGFTAKALGFNIADIKPFFEYISNPVTTALAGAFGAVTSFYGSTIALGLKTGGIQFMRNISERSDQEIGQFIGSDKKSDIRKVREESEAKIEEARALRQGGGNLEGAAYAGVAIASHAALGEISFNL